MVGCWGQRVEEGEQEISSQMEGWEMGARVRLVKMLFRRN